MSSKIMYIPLDNRPCNYEYPELILNISDYELLRPPFSQLGRKKSPADIEVLWQWMTENVNKVDYLILSIDMLLFGGIVPSRLHNISLQEAGSHLNQLGKLKEINPDLKIYGFNLIMRVPAYDSAEEEPIYYENYGCKIFKYGSIQDKISQGIASPEEKESFNKLKKEIPKDVMRDYLNRRKINHKVNLKVIDLVKDGIIDFLVIPMDDNSEFSFSSQERRKIMAYVQEMELLNKVYAYPGADEVGSVLIARAFTNLTGHKTRVFIRYASEKGKLLIPKLEDRSLCESVKYQIIASGGVIVDNSQMADYILMVNPPTESTLNRVDSWISPLHRSEIDDPERNLNEFVEAIKFYLEEDINCAVADVALVNGADPVLMKLLKSNKLLNKLLAYGAWNTSSNTLGTVVAHGAVASYYLNKGDFNTERKIASEKFLYLRYLEDWGYQHQVRTEISETLSDYWLTYFDLKDKGDYISGLIKERLLKFSKENINDLDYDFNIYMPWNRMFEVGIKME